MRFKKIIFSIAITHLISVQNAKTFTLTEDHLVLNHLAEKKVIKIDLTEVKKGILFVFLSQKCLCSPDALYALNETFKKYREKDLLIIGLNVDNDVAPSIRLNFIESLGYKFPVYLDVNYKLADTFGIKSTPQVVLLDKNKKLVYKGAIIKETIENSKFISKNYLDKALDQFIKNRPINPKFVSFIGCAIKPGVFDSNTNFK